jgi:hypothetical protein
MQRTVHTGIDDPLRGFGVQVPDGTLGLTWPFSL